MNAATKPEGAALTTSELSSIVGDQIPDCVLDSLPNSVYHSPRLSALFVGNSALKSMAHSMANYYGEYLDPARPVCEPSETPAQLWGNLVHCALFEFDQLGERYRIGPEVANKNMKAWQDFKKNLPPECAAVDTETFEMAQAVREAVLAIPDLREALQSPAGVGERSAFFTHPETGVRGKIRPDWTYQVRPDAVILFDGKTYESADPDEFARQAARMAYHVQAAYYTDGYQWATGHKVLGFVFIVVEKTYPFVTSAVMLDENAIAAGRREYTRLLRAYAQCRASGVWPAFGNSIRPISLPTWALEAA